MKVYLPSKHEVLVVLTLCCSILTGVLSGFIAYLFGLWWLNLIILVVFVTSPAALAGRRYGEPRGKPCFCAGCFTIPGVVARLYTYRALFGETIFAPMTFGSFLVIEVLFFVIVAGLFCRLLLVWRQAR
jgi:hypothetical protein